MPAAYWLIRDRRFQFLDSLLERDDWSVQQIQQHQAERLNHLFRIAHANNSYWREKFQAYGVNPQGADPFHELSKLPILTKDELRQNWRRMRSTHLPDREVVHEASSGSTGAPVNVYQSRYYRNLHAAMDYRSRRWMNVEIGEPFLAIGAHGARAHRSTKARIMRSLRLIVERGNMVDPFYIAPEITGPRLRRAAKRGVVHIYGYTTALVTVAKLARDMKIEFPSLKAVSSTSEQLLQPLRELLEEVFRVKVFDCYGSREVQSISMQCSNDNHHIYEDVNIVEFVTLPNVDEGMHAVIVTPLDNEAMPMFRYRNGDSASPVPGTCPCGRRLRLMTPCCGRICNNFITPDGRIISGTYFLYYFYYQEGFKSWQFHQTSPDHIDLYVVPDGVLTNERRAYLLKCCQKIESDYNNQFNVQLHIVEEIPPRSGGKHLYTISDVLSTV